MTAVQSPCTNICVINPRTRLCKGCARTIDEIAEWGMASEARKQEIVEACQARTVQPDRHAGESRNP